MVKKPKTEYDKFGRCGFGNGTGCIRPANGTDGYGWCMSCEDDAERAMLPDELKNYSRRRLDQFVRDNPDAYKNIRVETVRDAHYEWMSREIAKRKANSKE